MTIAEPMQVPTARSAVDGSYDAAVEAAADESDTPEVQQRDEPSAPDVTEMQSAPKDDESAVIDDKDADGLKHRKTASSLHGLMLTSLSSHIERHMMPLYSHPKQRQRWGDTQLHPHTNWGDVFFDLFYVSA